MDDISKLEELLAAEDSDEEQTEDSQDVSTNNKTSPATDRISFLEDVIENETKVLTSKKKNVSKSESPINHSSVNKDSVVHSGDTDSSDDEDKKNIFERKYDDYGSNIKKIIASKENNKSFSESYKGKSAESSFTKNIPSNSKKVSVPSKNNDVYSDPVFNIRISNPLISGSALSERMQGREAITMHQVKKHVSHGDLNKDWVIAGIIVRKSSTKESQKGSQYCIWTLSDLKGDLKTVGLFLFRNAYKQLWKTAEGTVVGILNPNVLDKRDDSNDQACLSVDNPDRVMIMGKSKDFGFCKSKKKNGDQCTSFVNINQCEYCIFHVKQEYQKCSRRSDLQTNGSNRGLNGLRNKVLGKDTVFYAGKSFTAVSAPKNKKLEAADKNRLQSLSEYFKSSDQEKLLINKTPIQIKNKKFANHIDVDKSQRVKDFKRLELLKGFASESINANIESMTCPRTAKKSVSPLQSKLIINKTPESEKKNSELPVLGFALKKTAMIDLSVPYGKKQNERAKQNAIKWIKENGPLNKYNPNNTRGSIEGKKRLIENSQSQNNDETPEQPKKKLKTGVESDSFQKLMNLKSAHSNLVTQHEDEEQDKYFSKLEKKEAMEEKMLNTFKIACKAVKCLKCSYTSFSASQNCKDNKHPLKVFDSFKRFFKCSNCGNRTATLNLIPLHSCKNCQSSKWERAAMINEKKGVTIADTLSIRGEEEKFLGGAIQKGANLNLLVPDE